LNHNYYIPTEAAYKNAIHAIWQVEHAPLFNKEFIIPKGVIEVIFNFSDSNSIPAQLGDKNHQLSNCFINGFNTAPIQIQLPQKQVFFGIIFQPSAVKKIFKAPGSEFADLTVDLTLIDSTFNSLWHQLAEQVSFDDRVKVFLNWLSKNLVEWQPQEQLMNNFLYAPNQHDLSVTKLASSLCYSPRHLSRKLSEATGMNAEEILLYKKYLHAVELMHQTKLSLTEIAHQSQFTDQSHFIKTFKGYASITPGAYRRKMSFVKGHIYDNVR
jgi:AraC-like DNA-binding protein